MEAKDFKVGQVVTWAGAKIVNTVRVLGVVQDPANHDYPPNFLIVQWWGATGVFIYAGSAEIAKGVRPFWLQHDDAVLLTQQGVLLERLVEKVEVEGPYRLQVKMQGYAETYHETGLMESWQFPARTRYTRKNEIKRL